MLHPGHIDNPKLRLRDRSVAAGITALVSGAVALLAEALGSETLARCLWYGALVAALLAGGFGLVWQASSCPKCQRRLLNASAVVMSPFRARCPHCGVAFHRDA